MKKTSSKAFAVLLIALFVAAPVFAQKQKHGYQLDRRQRPVAITGEEQPGEIIRTVQPHSGFSSNSVGPGLFLMQSYYDYGSNGGVLKNIERYANGTMAIGRMGAPDPATNDRGTYFWYFDGIEWFFQGKVEASRRGWSNLAALDDLRNVVAAHSAASDIIGNELNIDALPGFGIWTSTLTGWATNTRAIWPRLTVDGANTIIVCSTTDGNLFGVNRSKEVAVSRDEGAFWTHEILFPDTSVHTPQFNTDDQAIDSYGNQVAVAVSEFGGDIHLWESADNGNSWRYRNLTNYPLDIPVGSTAVRPYIACDAIYDNEGQLHLFWEGLFATQDSAGTGLELSFDRNIGIQHWSEATGITQVVSWSDLPNAGRESDAALFAAGVPFDQVNAQGILTMQPQAGIDADGTLFLIFAALRPLDYDPVDSTHYTDVYALGSTDGGATWGEVVNITNTPQSEDLWASLADEVDDSLRFVYQSDGETGNSIQGGGQAPTNLLYYAFPKSNIPLQSVAQITLTTPDTLSGFPGELIEVAINLALEGNQISALGAALKATNRNLTYEGFTPGPILPPNATFTVQAITPDSVRFAFVDFGDGPITRTGVLATLQFRVDRNAAPGSFSDLFFSVLSASNEQLQTVRVRSNVGTVSIHVHDTRLAIPDNLTGAPGDTVEVPVSITVAGNEISALGAAIKAGGGFMQFAGFVPGEVIPGANFLVHAVTHDSVRLAYVDFGGGPLTRDGALARLYFAIAATAPDSAVASLRFSDVSASRPNFDNLTVQSSPGRLTVEILAGKISGVLFEDVNGNGKRDGNEPGLAGRQVKLTGAGAMNTVTTNSLGEFVLSNLKPNRYQLVQEVPPRWVQSFPSQGGHEFDLASGGNLNFDFGSWQYATVAGSVWHDLNANQVRDASERGLSKWPLTLSGVLGNGQAVTLTLSTSRVGSYAALRLAPGEYELRQRLPMLWVQTFPTMPAYSIVLTSGLARDSLDFGAFDIRIDPEDSLARQAAARLAAIPETFTLLQNYPNPFNPATNLVFGLPQETHVKLEVFDLMGKRVALLADGLMPPGYHELHFDASTLAGGIYWYQLTTPQTVLRRKLMYLR